MELKGKALEDLTSSYWSGGFQKDVLKVHSMLIDGKKAIGQCSVPEYFICPGDIGFHVSMLHAVGFVCQVGIAHALYLNEIQKKTMDVVMSDFDIKLGQVIRSNENIVIQMELYSRAVHSALGTRRKGRSFYRWKFSVNDGLWWGSVGLVFPFTKEQQQSSAA